MLVTSWSAAQRVFLIVAGTILSLHFTLIYLFVQDQLSPTGRGSSYGRSNANLPSLDHNGYIQDERSPLEKDASNTDWGMDFQDPSLLPHRHLVAHSRDALGHGGRGEGMGRRRVNGYNGIVPSSIDGALSAAGPGRDYDAVGKLFLGNDAAGGGGTVNGSNSSDACLGQSLLTEDFDEPLAWQDVVPGSAAVFSAYLDTTPGGQRANRLVVIGLAGPGVLEDLVFECQVWYRHPTDDVQSWVVKATAVWLQKGGEKTGGDVFFYCPAIPEQDPVAVSVLNRKRCAQSPPNLLLIRNIDESQARTRPVNNFTVCVPPLRNRFNDHAALVETAELNFLLGANRMVFYDEETSDIVKDFYNSYKHEDTATVIPWKPPGIITQKMLSKDNRLLIQPTGSNIAGLSALNDCLYRFRFSSKYVVFVDIGEFILPEMVRDWNDLMLMVSDKPGISVFRFRRVLFQFPANSLQPEVSDKQIRLLSQLKKGRLRTLPFGVTSRYMVSPTYVDIVGTNDVISRRKGVTLEVSDRDAGVHDYYHRHQGINSAPIVEERRAKIYHSALLWRVKKRNALVRGKE